MRPYVFLRSAELKDLTLKLLSHAEEGYVDTSLVPGDDVTVMEEPGRRVGVLIAPGNARNALARAVIADTATAVANTPGGGVLLVGVEDPSGQIVGTQLDAEYVLRGVQRARIQAEVDVHVVCGQRVLALTIAPSRLPLDNSSGVVTWRRGGKTEVTDRFSWWQAHSDAAAFDPFAGPSGATLADVPPESLAAARALRPKFSRLTPQLFLRHIGAVHASGHLSKAGELLLCPAGRVAIAVERDGHVIAPDASLSVLQQLQYVQEQLRHVGIEAPNTAYHEALLNGVVHRDWENPDPTIVRVEEHCLTVDSPGGFHGGIRPASAVSRHDAASPALTDLFRELHLLDKQVSGVHRMIYRMIFAGFPPPTLEQVDSGVYPLVRCRFDTHARDEVMADVARDMVPADRAFDHRLALILFALRRRESVSVPVVRELLSCSEADAWDALRAAAQTMRGSQPLIVPRDGQGDAAVLVASPSPVRDAVFVWNNN